MSLNDLPGNPGLRVSHVPAGGGPAYWVYSDLDTFKATGKETAGTLTVMETVILPKAGPPPHIHARETESFYVLDGDIDVLDRDRVFSAHTGSFVHLPQGGLHAWRNPGERPARILLLFAPAGFEDFLVEAGEPLGEHNRAAPAVPTDLDTAHRLGARYGVEFPPHPDW